MLNLLHCYKTYLVGNLNFTLFRWQNNKIKSASTVSKTADMAKEKTDTLQGRKSTRIMQVTFYFQTELTEVGTSTLHRIFA